MDQDGPAPKPRNKEDNLTKEEIYDFHLPPLHPKQQKRLTRLQQPTTSISSIPNNKRNKRNSLTFASINANGLCQKPITFQQRQQGMQASNKNALLQQIINTTDICAIQETHLNNQLAKTIIHKCTGKGLIILHHGTTSSSGVGLFFSTALKQKIASEQLRDDKGYILLI